MCRFLLPRLNLIVAAGIGITPLLARAAEVPEELVALHGLVSSIPDCQFEYRTHYHPPIEGIRFHDFRFITKNKLWRFDRMDKAGRTSDSWCFDGRLHQIYHRDGNMLIILPNPVPEKYQRDFPSMFSSNPLFMPLFLPFQVQSRDFRMPEIQSLPLWQEVLGRSVMRTALEVPAGQAHFIIDDDAVNGIVKLERNTIEGLPPWRIIAQEFYSKKTGAKGALTFGEWRKFELGDSRTLYLPGRITSANATIVLHLETVSKVPDHLPTTAFSVPRNAVTQQPFDFTVPQPTPSKAKAKKPQNRQ
jgi:hypothetical protein